MKKILSILMIMALMGGVVFAQTGPEPVVKGGAVLSWGIDFGQGNKDITKNATHGFKNEASASVSINFLKNKFFAKGEGDVYAYIGVNRVNIGLVATLGGNADVRGIFRGLDARLVFFGGYMTVYGAPGLGTNFAQMWTPIEDPYGSYSAAHAGINTYGTKIGYSSEDLAGTGISLDTGLKFLSNGAWDDKTNSKYAMGYDLNFAYKNYVSFDFTINGTLVEHKKYAPTGEAASNPKTNPDLKDLNMGFAIGTEAVEGLNVKIGMDAVMNTGADKDKPQTAIDFALHAQYKWVALGLFAGNKYSSYGGINKDGEATGDLGLRIALRSGGDPEDPTNLVAGLNFGVDFRVHHLMTHITDLEKEAGHTVPLGFKAWIDYTANITDAMTIMPYFAIWGETNAANTKYADDTALADRKEYFAVAYNIGLEFSPLERTTIFLDWQHGRPTENYAFGNRLIKDPCRHNWHNGTFTMGLRVVY